MKCKECNHISSDCNGGGMWYICTHPILNQDLGEERAVYKDEQPEWCPLKKSNKEVI